MNKSASWVLRVLLILLFIPLTNILKSQTVYFDTIVDNINKYDAPIDAIEFGNGEFIVLCSHKKKLMIIILIKIHF